jgi:putative nucleotidyltransferase with HDIG domain
VGLWIADKDGTLLRGNPAGVKIWGTEPKVGQSDYGIFKGRRLPSGEDIKADDWALAHTIRDKVTIVDELLEIDAFDGKKKTILNFSAPVLDAQGVIQGAIVVNQDITEIKQADNRIRRQLEHLLALSSIDRLIASNFDLNLSLSEILNYVTKELGVDAADILILNPGLQMLEFGAGQGFRTNAIRNTQVRLGEGYAGQAALERQLVQIPNLKKEPENLFRKTLMAGENFTCYYGVPLIAKGQVKGVLEVFHRQALAPDAEWLDFLNTLAGQTAIAIENSTLFESLQRSNSELGLAYDATIEGWSHALDLRDRETEGHTQRVTDTTVKLARLIGMSEADLVQVRWGALLHDIGKMGVPDGILHKPGPLTDEEWLVMKKHPDHAYEMLSPIRYLRMALDIPYCHHEKWDGSGYPRGLKGAQIPLVARIFSVVDVWDALRSDRPYRQAWAEEKVREYIRGSVGTHFDPQVVDVFMQLLDVT